MRKFLIILSGAVALAATVAGFTAQASAADMPTPPKRSWSFDGPFGTFDLASLQRGYQVYKEVCSNCHSMKYVAFRNLADLGYSEAQIKTLAAQIKVTDGPNKAGDMYQRPGRPSDYFPAPFANDNAARANFNGALPPDLSLIAKARKGGPDYIVALLEGFTNPPPGFKVPDGRYYNEYFPGHKIAMPPPLTAGAVTYSDGTKATLDQEARDVANFLMWTAEPKLEERHRVGIKVILYLVVLAGVFYFAKRKIWSDVH